MQNGDDNPSLYFIKFLNIAEILVMKKTKLKTLLQIQSNRKDTYKEEDAG